LSLTISFVYWKTEIYKTDQYDYNNNNNYKNGLLHV
jgi:hypothetical protein